MPLVLCILYSLALAVLANADSDPLSFSVAAVQQTGDDLTDEVLAALSMGNRQLVHTRIKPFEKIIQPMFSSTPKNEFGRLGHTAVRYILHRFFVNRHGWFVHDIFAGQGGASWNGSSVNALLEKHTTSFVQQAFVNGLSKKGLDLRGVALLAAVVEVGVYENTESDLRVCYQMQHIPLDSIIDADQVDSLLALHVGRRVLENNAEKALRKFLTRPKTIKNNEYSIKDVEHLLKKVMPQWPLTTEFLINLRQELLPGRSDFPYETVAGLAREIEGRWARWASTQDCQSMKTELRSIEEGNSGCVRLSDFYNYSFSSPSGWSFKESPSYLTQLGVLDESRDVPRVIISNYLQSQSNCLPMTKHYMACCVNECEELQAQIESSLQAPEAQPEVILRIVDQLPSQGLDGKQQIPIILKRHLEEIAVLHGGLVPLQSRLFTQWMHFVFPHECPFPHLAGSKAPEQPHLADHFVKRSLALQIVEAGSHQKHTQTNGTCMQWSDQEELFVPTLVPSTTTLAALEQDTFVWASIYLVGLLSLFALLLGILLKGLQRLKPRLVELQPSLV